MEKHHYWEYCMHCDCMMVICGTCGNNTCNAGYGTLEDGSACPDCPSAYDMCHNTETPPLPTNHKEISDKFHKELQEALDNGSYLTDKWIDHCASLRAALIWGPKEE